MLISPGLAVDWAIPLDAAAAPIAAPAIPTFVMKRRRFGACAARSLMMLFSVISFLAVVEMDAGFCLRETAILPQMTAGGREGSLSFAATRPGPF
jgi:hypothetical protein